MVRFSNALLLVGLMAGMVGSLMAIGFVLLTEAPKEGLIPLVVVVLLLLFVVLPFQRRQQPPQRPA